MVGYIGYSLSTNLAMGAGTMIGRVIGPYEVVASIGRGGMGEVFKARDQKLGRDVALKVLPPELAKDTERLARFQREARVLASLQHQNIAAIFGLEESDGQPVLAMELAAGEDLSTRLLKGPLPENEIEKISRQLAKGLEYAHEQGIVHRDLKPANVKVSGDGSVKILDFGLARAFTADSVAEGESESHSYQPTITQALTGSGTVLGTAAYMSPEQARGYEVDRRGDIWAFGVILYEMLTGDRLFEGETATDTLAAVLHKEPDWDALEGEHPALLLQICRRCLEKDAKQRLRDIGEVRVALEGTGSSVIGLSTASLNPALVAPVTPVKALVPWIVAAALAIFAVGGVLAGYLGLIGPAPKPWPLVQSAVMLPPGLTLNLVPVTPGLAQVSPDGRYLAFAAIDSTGTSRVMVQNLAEGSVRGLNGTESASYIFWSPDSREVAFVTGGDHLLRTPINGGPTVQIALATNGKGGSWNQFDQVVYAPTHMSSIMMVPATGGEPVDVTRIDQDEGFRSHRLPQWLPDGKHFQYIAVSRGSADTDLDCTVRVVEAATGKSTDLLQTQSNALFADGHLLYPHDGILMARPLDLETIAFTGPAFPLLAGVLTMRPAHLSAFSANASGVLVYSESDSRLGESQLMRYTASGEEIGPLGEPVMSIGFNFSPDGRFICLGIPDDRAGTLDLWQYDVQRELKTRITFAPESEWFAVYAPDGKWLAVLSDALGHAGLYRISAAAGGNLEPLLVNDEDNYPGSFTPDGTGLYFSSADSTGMMRLNLLDLESGDAIRVHPGAQVSESAPAVSPDGNWLAYLSRETGSGEIFVESVDVGGGRWRVSASGGTHPRWSPGSDVIYYYDGSHSVQATSVKAVDGGLQFGQTRRVVSGVESSFVPTYAIDPVSGDIVTNRASRSRASSAIKLVTGWQNLLNRDRKD